MGRETQPQRMRRPQQTQRIPMPAGADAAPPIVRFPKQTAHVVGNAQASARKAKQELGPMDSTFLVLVLLILSIGLIVLFSASYATAYYEHDNSFYYISRQLLFAVVGVVAMLIISRFNYQILHKFALVGYAGAIFLLVVVLMIPTREDAKRWINLGFTTFQPSEIAKFALILIFAHLISINYEKMKDPKYGIWPFLILMGLICMLMLMEPHLSGTVLIVSIGIVMMFVGGTDVKWFVLGGVLLVGLTIAIALIPGVVPYAMSRITHWLDPRQAAQGEGYQTLQSLYAIGSGGPFGVGIGNSRQKHLYLPEVQNDFVFSIACEELGFIGATLIIMLFVLLIWRGYVIAMRCKDRFGSMLTIGLVTQVGIQTILNIGVVTNTIPNTGISLPFFSYGGTSLVMLLAQMGVVLAVSRQTTLEKLD